MNDGNEEIKIGTHFSKKWMDKNTITVKIEDIQSISLKNNLANVMLEKGISSHLSDSDLEKCNCSREVWQSLLEGKEGFCYQGSNENLFRIGRFLGVASLCDLWGSCAKSGAISPCGKCNSNHSWKQTGVEIFKSDEK